MPKFSIITPTLLRTTAHRTMRSVDDQTSNDYEHIVIVDGIAIPVPGPWMENPRRRFMRCPFRHNDSGATCRVTAITIRARGDYVLYLDDDDYYVPDAIETLAREIQGEPFGVFPIMLSGEVWLHLPPGPCKTPTCGLYHRREIGGEILRPPAPQKHYAEDSEWAGVMAERHGWRAIDCHPLAIVERGHNSSNLPGGPPMTVLPGIKDMEVQDGESLRER